MSDEPWKNLFDSLELLKGPIERNQPMEPDERDWASLEKPSTLEQRRVFWKNWLESLSWEGELERNQPVEQQERAEWNLGPETDVEPENDK